MSKVALFYISVVALCTFIFSNAAEFKIQKLNLVWEKASQRLSEQKLKTLYSDLKVQEKEEIVLKRAIADGLDKEGLKEAETRRRLKGLLTRYGLADSFEDPAISRIYSTQDEIHDEPFNKDLFKDKKLQKLWMKAEQSGFTETELKNLREEFLHHQEKIDEYYSVLERNHAEQGRDFNKLDNNISELGPEELIRQKHRSLKDNYNRLHKMSLSGPNGKDFVEPKVQALWKSALQTNFSSEELESLHTELKHYENRIVKLHYLEGQSAALKEKKMDSIYSDKDLKGKIKDLEKRAAKLHTDFESRIMQKRIEL
ncbi:alpha-2-macroglobulin receptor-associated protein-like [Artemia franciscana]|uniref:alpha-2-macroglobulin receptor-associated protein-like n=1 Tax=Artemia franciscana TaxID=6661 RepID=UPI0032D9FFEB